MALFIVKNTYISSQSRYSKKNSCGNDGMVLKGGGGGGQGWSGFGAPSVQGVPFVAFETVHTFY